MANTRSNQTTGHLGRYIKVTITATAQSAAERGRPAPWDEEAAADTQAALRPLPVPDT